MSLLVLFVVAAILACNGSLIGDEYVHYYLIDRFRVGDFRISKVFSEYLTMLPGYHLLIAGLMALFGATTLGAARLISLAFALATIALFHLLRRPRGDASLATAQFMVLPVLHSYFFLVYTDVLSLGLVLGATLATLARRHWLSAIVMLAAMAVRQNNIIWAGFLCVLAAWPLLREHGLAQWQAILRTAAPYSLDLFAFMAFWHFNGSVSLSHAQAPMHPDLKLHVGNIYYALFLLGVLMPVQLLQGLPVFARRVAANKVWLALPLALLAVFWCCFAVDHPYNLIAGKVSLRNMLLIATIAHPMLRAAIGIVATIAACGLVGIRLQPEAARWLYPFAAIFLSASWLIETRYALIPLALWLSFREPSTPNIERATFVYWFVVATGLFINIIDHGPFL